MQAGLETPCHAWIATSPQDPTAMSPDHWSKLTWDTVSAGGYDLFDPIGYLDRKRDRAYKQRVILTPAQLIYFGEIHIRIYFIYKSTLGYNICEIPINM